ncbi:MAG: phosphatidate cytidylyltransferase [Pseudolabrys sp.]
MRSNLTLRIASAIVLAPIAIAAAWFGGWLFVGFWFAAAVAVLWEWLSLTGARASRLLFPSAALALAVTALVAGRERPLAAMLVVLLGAIAVAVFAPSERRSWVMGGVVYAGALLLAPVLLRADAQLGFAAIVFLFGVVWATDILGYFVGRAVGGPKLAPAISPGKTWAGAIGGTAAAIGVAYVGARLLGASGGPLALIVLAVLLSIVAQCGDLLESWIKRRFDAKDASHIIPGHGGVMDRLDGFWAAALVAAIIGILRGGFEAPARGLLLW